MIVIPVLLVVVLGTAIPRRADAQLGAVGSMVAAVWKEIKDQARWVYQNAKAALEKAQKTQYSIAFKNGLRVFLGKVAEDTAVWVSSAGTGQKPLFITKPHYWTNLGDAAAGDFLDTVSKDVFGKSICEPPDTSKKLQIELGVRNLENPLNFCENACNRTLKNWDEDTGAKMKRYVDLFQQLNASQPKQIRKCPLNEMLTYAGFMGPFPEDGQTSVAECFKTLQTTYTDERQLVVAESAQCLKDCNKGRKKAACTATQAWGNLRDNVELTFEIQAYFEADQSDIGQLLTLSGLTQEKAASEVEAQRTIYEDNTGSITSKLGTDILVPNILVKEKAKQPINESSDIEKTQTGSLLADTIGIFTNTLTKRLMDRFFKSKCGLNPAACKGPGQTESRLGELLFGSSAPTGIAAARLQFASLARIDYRVGDPARSQIDVGDRLVAQGIINSAFKQAIDERLTLREAIERGLVDGNLTFGFDESDAEAERGIPYRSIVYLRKYRVVPVGWELAALHIREIDQRDYGIKELMDLYDFCGQDALHGIPNPEDPDEVFASPFCGLVDPSWVMKAPATYCRRQGVGDEIISRQFVCNEDTNGDGQFNCSQTDLGGGDLGTWVVTRNQETCVDEPSCVKEDEQGNCVAYGYCYEERPTWRFGGDECPGQYASCRSYTSSTGLAAQYLKNTLDVGNCTADNAGCRGYCPETGYNAVDGTWNCRAAGGNLRFFDKGGEACSDRAIGCTELVRTANGSNILKNASFEYFSGTIDDGAADTFGYCSDSGLACATDADCTAEDPASFCDGWRRNGAASAEAVTSDNSGVGAPNAAALVLDGAGGTIEHQVDPGQPLSGLTVTFSFYGKSLGGDCSGTFGVRSTDGSVSIDGDPAPTYTSSWQRFPFTATLPEQDYTSPTLTAFIGNECNVAIDAAKLEYGNRLTVFTDYQSVNEVSLKLPSGTLLTNGDFAQDDGTDFFSYPPDPAADNAGENDNLPDGWGPSGTLEIDPAVGYFDTNSVRLTANNDRSYLSQLVPVEYGKTYEASGWIKTSLTNGGGVPFGSILTECVYGASHERAFDTFFPDADEPSSCLLANYESYLKPSSEAHDGQYAIEGATDWTPVRYTLTANNPDIGFMRVLCLNKADNASGMDNSGSGEVWCDDLRVTESSLSCAKEEVGCERYRPVGPGSPVSGVVRSGDFCPANQVGCRQFREMPIERIPQRPAVDPAYFIETSGQTCTASEVGCEEYTNLDEAAAGGEAKEYFTAIRQCVKPSDPNAGNYYTWEGSEEDGFQLRAYKLLKSDQTDYNGETGQAPCTNLEVGSTTDAPDCVDGVQTPAVCDPADIGINPDCTEFFGEAANVYYRLRSRTIAVSDDCHPYRNSIDAAAGFDNIYTILPSGSIRCPARAASCRQYKGTTADATRAVYAETFESGSVNGWSGGVTYSNESVNAGGHSMRTTAGVVPSIDLTNVITNGNSYSLKFAFKARAPGQIQFQIRAVGADTQESESNIVDVRNDWAQYELGPIYLNATNSPTQYLLDVIETAGGWIDNIALIESIDSLYRIKGSTTGCDAANAGCRLYVDRSNEPVTVTGFSNLCADRAVGCEAFTATQNSDYPFVSRVREDPLLRAPGDITLSYVNSSKNRCREEEQGCRRFGLAAYDASNVPTAWTEATLIDDPDTYALSVCRPDEEWCEAYTEEITDSTAYFRDPGNRTCEYRQGASYGGKLVDGWFITGTNTPCPSISMTCRGGSQAGTLCRTADQQQACIDGLGYCIAYPAGGEEKQVDLYCAGTCQGGGSPGQTCFTNGECSNVCVGGDNQGQACLKDEDCPDSTCSFGTCGDGSARPLCDGRRSGDPTTDQGTCLDEDGVCAPLPPIGQPSLACAGGPRNNESCITDADCCLDGDCGDPVATCSVHWVGLCAAGAAGCTEFRDPLDPGQSPKYPAGCNVDCTFATDRNGNELRLGPACQPEPADGGRPGCRPYYILRQSLSGQVAECNSQIDFEIGCQPFFDTENPFANFIGG